MLNSDILEIVFGMVFVILLLSLLATIVNEFIATFTRMRASTLKEAIYRMLEDGPDRESGLAKAFYDHPLIRKLTGKNGSPPSYLAPSTFSQVLKDILSGSGNPADALAALKSKAARLPEGETRTWLLSLLDNAGNSVQTFTTAAEDWFNKTMDRASGWFKRKMQLISIGVGFAIAIALNADSISIFRHLNKNSEVRTQLAALADDYLARTEQEVVQSDETANPVKIDTALGDSTRPHGRQRSARSKRPASAQPSSEISSLMKKYEKLLEDDLRDANQLLGLGWRNFESERDDFRCGKADRNKASAQNRKTDRAKKPRDTGKQRRTRPGGDSTQADPPASAPHQEGSWSAFVRCSPITFWFLKGIGWLITALAISLGAPFWFDVLKRVTNIRGTGAKSS